jgi:uncharacterized membrane protein
MKKTTYLVQGALIAAIYVVLALAFAPISYGPMQIRIAEILTVLPYLTPAAIPGVFVGCLIANLYSDAGMLDVIFGSLATLIAAILTYRMPKRWLAPLPPVVVNVVIIPVVLYYALELPYWLSVAGVLAGQMIACYGLGYPLLLILERYKLLQK